MSRDVLEWSALDLAGGGDEDQVGHAAPPTSIGPNRPARSEYVRKPFSYPELRGRIGALLRRADHRRRGGRRLRVGDLEVDPLARAVRLRGADVALSQKEFALLRLLASEPTRVFTKDELLRAIWGFRHLGTKRRIAS
jgi:DNA-binding response OmpR family regulator